MSYEKQTWQTGDTVTSAKLNHMEDGIAAGSALISNLTLTQITEDEILYHVFTADKTLGEIKSAIASGQAVTFRFNDVGIGADVFLPVLCVTKYGEVYALPPEGNMSLIGTYTAEDDTDYPSLWIET